MHFWLILTLFNQTRLAGADSAITLARSRFPEAADEEDRRPASARAWLRWSPRRNRKW